MRKMLLLCLLLVVPALQAAPLSLVQNEYNFAAAVKKHGVRDGFLAYLAPQSITLAPEPVNAYQRYSQRKPDGTVLTWYPSYALVSAADDLGVDTGPWTATGQQGGKTLQAHGEWVTVWARDKAGHWKVLFDGGIDHPAPATPVKALKAKAKARQLPASRLAAPTREDTQYALVRAEEIFSNDAMDHGLRAAYQYSGSRELRVLLDNSEPLLGVKAVAAQVSAQPAGLDWNPMGGSVSNSGDLGYVYGMTYRADDGDHKTPLKSYMHVWSREAGVWKLLIALELPLH